MAKRQRKGTVVTPDAPEIPTMVGTMHNALSGAHELSAAVTGIRNTLFGVPAADEGKETARVECLDADLADVLGSITDTLVTAHEIASRLAGPQEGTA